MFSSSQGAGRHRMGAAFAGLSAMVVVSLTGCASAQQSGASSQGTGGVPPRLDATLYKKAVDAAKQIAGGQKLDPSIEMIGVNGGAEGDVLKGVYTAFTDATGTKVNYTGSQDENNIVQSRVSAGNPPAVVDQAVGVATQYAKQGKLVDIGSVVGADQLKATFGDSLVNGVTVNGKTFGLYQGFSNFMVWYNPQTYQGPKNPQSWDQLVKYTDQQAAQGKQTWCIAEDAGGGSGFPGAQFIENIFAKKYGPDLLRQWGASELSWTSPQVKDAFQEFGKIATNNKLVSGGRAGALAAPIATGYNGLIAPKSTCQLALWGAWVPGLIGQGVKPTVNLDFFRVPGFSNGHDGTEIFQTTVTTAFKDSPTVRAFLKYVASDQAQALLASADQWPVADLKVSPDTYHSALLKKAAQTYFAGAKDIQLSTGPNVMANSAVQTAFFKGVVSYLQNPSSLDQVLQSIQAAATAK